MTSSPFTRLLRNPLGMTALAVLFLITALAIAAPWISPADPAATDLSSAFAGPSAQHPLGADGSGRDVLSRLLYGARVSLLAGVIAVIVAAAIGLPTGLLAGYHGGRTDAALGWVANVIMSVPNVIIVLVVIAAVGPGLPATMSTIGVLLSPFIFRLTRATTLGIRSELYVDAAKISGLSDARIIRRHVLRAVRTPLIIQAAEIAGVAILIQSGLEFLGLGDSSVPSWGASLNEAFKNIYRAPALILPPGIAISLTVASLALFAAALSDSLEGTRRSRSNVRALRYAAMQVRPSTVRPEGSSPELLSIDNLRVAHTSASGSDIEVVRGVSLHVGRGEILGLVGESGSGKSQTSFAILGLLPASARVSAERFVLAGADVAALDAEQRRSMLGTRIGYIPQEPMSNLAPSFTVANQLTTPMRYHLGLSKAQARRRATELLERVGIVDVERVLSSYSHQISGGMAQRVLIAAALSCDPEILIADEPTTALDVTVQAEVLDLIRDLATERGLGVILVTHDFGVVADVCDRVSVMNSGVIVENAPVDELFASPEHPYTRALLGATLNDGPTRAQLDHDARTDAVEAMR